MIKKMSQFLDMDDVLYQLERARYVLLPVSYDGTSTFVKGADKGPQAILDASDSLELYYGSVQRRNPYGSLWL